MEFNTHEIDLLRQWFNSVQDCNPEYLNEEDFKLAKKLGSIKRTPLPREHVEPDEPRPRGPVPTPRDLGNVPDFDVVSEGIDHDWNIAEGLKVRWSKFLERVFG